MSEPKPRVSDERLARHMNFTEFKSGYSVTAVGNPLTVLEIDLALDLRDSRAEVKRLREAFRKLTILMITACWKNRTMNAIGMGGQAVHYRAVEEAAKLLDIPMLPRDDEARAAPWRCTMSDEKCCQHCGIPLRFKWVEGDADTGTNPGLSEAAASASTSAHVEPVAGPAASLPSSVERLLDAYRDATISRTLFEGYGTPEEYNLRQETYLAARAAVLAEVERLTRELAEAPATPREGEPQT